MKYQTWAIHDKKDNTACNEIYNFLQRWSPAPYGQCKYGTDTLKTVLPDILKSLRIDFGDTSYTSDK